MNLEIVERIVTLLDSHAVSEIVVEQDGQRIVVRKPLSFAPAAPLSPFPPAEEPLPTSGASPETVPSEEALLAAEAHLLTSPMVGIFHHAEPPIRYGASLAAQQVVGSIESMKLMNEVTADSAGRVAEVLIEDGAPVEYGQALFRLTLS